MEKSGIISRRRAREAALQALYHCDTLGDCSEGQLAFFFSHFFAESEVVDAGALFENGNFAKRLVLGVVSELAAVDQFISSASSHWSVNRMARVDRNIIRIADYEIAFVDEVPVNVAINEAIEISKRYGAPDSPVFVNGVLDHVAKQIAAELPNKKAVAS